MKKNALRILVDSLPTNSEDFRQFISLVGEWWRDTDGGQLPTKPQSVESDLKGEEESPSRFKRDFKAWGFPGRLLPAVRNFRIELGKEDALFKAFKMRLKEGGKLKFETYSPNIHINRYVWHMVGRMHAAMLLKDFNKFWKIAKMLMNSRAYTICCTNHTLKGWHRKYSYGKVKKIVRKVEYLATPFYWPGEAQLRRAYIPKMVADKDSPLGVRIKGWRPLGVPSPEWRIYMHMFQNILTMWLGPHITENNHGFLPGKGVLTAWQQIMNEALTSDYIYEYDLKNFFGQISLDFIHDTMIAYGMTPRVARDFRRINRSLTSLEPNPMADRAPEPERDVRYRDDGQRNPSNPTAQHPMFARVLDLFNQASSMFQRKKMSTYIPDRGAKLETSLGGKLQQPTCRSLREGVKKAGVPQGLPTSPILSIAAFNRAMTSMTRNSCVAYADDFIKYGPYKESVLIGAPLSSCSPTTGVRWTIDSKGNWSWRQTAPTSIEQLMAKANIEVNWEKSAAVKEAGVWLKPLRFLGMEYDGNKQIFRAATRSGASLEFTDLQSVQAYLHNLRDHRDRTQFGSGDAWGLKLSMENAFRGMSGQAALKLAQALYRKTPGEPSWQDLHPNLLKQLGSKDFKFSWENLFKSKAYGYFMSRMQCDSWDQAIEQNFDYTFKAGSWADWRGPKFCDWAGIGKVDIFNSSSFAAACLMQDLNHEDLGRQRVAGIGGKFRPKPLVRKVFLKRPLVRRIRI